MDDWQRRGHEVRFLHVFHLPHAEWADVLWFDCIDGNLVTATRDHAAAIAGKKVVTRGIDIDVWAHHFGAVRWQHVHHAVFVARHIRDYLLSVVDLPSNVQVHHIPCGVDLNKFTLRREPVCNLDVAFVANLWSGKGIDLLLQFIAALPDFTFWICGRWGLSSLEERWHRRYIDQFLSHYRNWHHVESVPDMNEWLEDKTYTLVCSKKEAFSYAAAEGAAKGLAPLVHEFYGARDIWPADFLWREVCEAAARMRHQPYRPHEYRQYIERKYSFTEMMRRFDELLAD